MHIHIKHLPKIVHAVVEAVADTAEESGVPQVIVAAEAAKAVERAVNPQGPG